MPLETMTPPRLGVRQQCQLPRIALAYPDWAKRARYQADWPAVCWPSGSHSLADSGMEEMPSADRSLLMDCATATGSSPSRSRWLEISVGSVPAGLTWASHVCHSPEFCAGSADSDGPTMTAPGASWRISLTAVSHIWKYCVLFIPAFQNVHSSGSFQTS